MICSGNSITASTGASDLAHGWVSQLQTLLGARWLLVNKGVPGRPTSQMITDDVTAVDPLSSLVKPINLVTFQEVTNDLYTGLNSAVQATANVITWCAARRAAGFKILVLPMGPVPEPGTFPAGTETKRLAVNAALAAQAGVAFDYWLDPSALPQLYAPGANTNTSYYAVDQIHPNDAGHLLLAQTLAPIVRATVPWW